MDNPIRLSALPSPARGALAIAILAAAPLLGCCKQPPATPDFTVSPSPPRSSQAATFTAKPNFCAKTWHWDFGDGASATGSSANHVYSKPDNYWVTLVASNSYGSKSTTKAVTVVEGRTAPSARFLFGPASPLVGQTVSFSDTSTGNPTSWSWSFGDGGTSTASNPTHAYAAEGSYTVTLTAGNDLGSSSVSKIVTVFTPVTPKANFQAAPPRPLVGDRVYFLDRSTGPPDSWYWDFGDGGTAAIQGPSHVYAAAKTYTVRLTVANSKGSNSISQTISVASPGSPSADFSFAPPSPLVGQTVTFSDLSAGTPTSWSWDFGDGATETSQTATHAYGSEGTYNVTLTVTNANGSNSLTKPVSVVGPAKRSVTVPVAGHVLGLSGTLFVSDVEIENPNPDPVTADLFSIRPEATRRARCL